MTTTTFVPDYTVKPGETISETIKCLGMTKAEFARHMGIAPAYLHKLIAAKKPITTEIALKLEAVTHTSAAFWSALENNYRSAEMRLNRFDDKTKTWLSAHPLSEMVKRGWISGETRQARFQSLLTFYRVASPNAWGDVWERPLAAARVSPKHKVSLEAVAAFLRAGEIEAGNLNHSPFDASLLTSEITPLCEIIHTAPLSQKTLLQVRQLLAKSGVSLHFIKTIKNAPLNGATRWKDGTPVVILSLRTGRADQIWFALLHELHHVLTRRKTSGFLTFGQAWENSEEERSADAFAAERLLAQTHNSEILGMQTIEELQSFADKNTLALSLVIGRWQHLTQKFSRFSNYVHHFNWPDNVYTF